MSSHNVACDNWHCYFSYTILGNWVDLLFVFTWFLLHFTAWMTINLLQTLEVTGALTGVTLSDLDPLHIDLIYFVTAFDWPRCIKDNCFSNTFLLIGRIDLEIGTMSGPCMCYDGFKSCKYNFREKETWYLMISQWRILIAVGTYLLVYS